MEVGPLATKMVASMDQGTASLKEIATLSLPKELRAQGAGEIPTGYELTMVPMDDVPADVW